ncbi:MAG: enoyl-CoA hydratase/isomerase family protein [Jiangellaceae bacterium]
MVYKHILFTRPAEHVAAVTLHRPDVANALNRAMLAELADAVRRIAVDDDVHAWTLTGSPRPDGRPWFSAGVDMKEALAGVREPAVDGADICDAIDDMMKPSIAVINGTCTTGALEIVLACDLRIVGRGAQLSDFHMLRSGMAIGAWGVAARLSRLVGVDKAKELLLLSSTVDGAEAVRIGLANRMVEDNVLDAEALGVATTIAAMPRRGVRATLGYLAMQADLSKRDAIHLADLAPDVMGLELRPFRDAAARFFDDRPQQTVAVDKTGSAT